MEILSKKAKNGNICSMIRHLDVSNNPRVLATAGRRLALMLRRVPEFTSLLCDYHNFPSRIQKEIQVQLGRNIANSFPARESEDKIDNDAWDLCDDEATEDFLPLGSTSSHDAGCCKKELLLQHVVFEELRANESQLLRLYQKCGEFCVQFFADFGAATAQGENPLDILEFELIPLLTSPSSESAISLRGDTSYLIQVVARMLVVELQQLRDWCAKTLRNQADCKHEESTYDAECTRVISLLLTEIESGLLSFHRLHSSKDVAKEHDLKSCGKFWSTTFQNIAFDSPQDAMIACEPLYFPDVDEDTRVEAGSITDVSRNSIAECSRRLSLLFRQREKERERRDAWDEIANQYDLPLRIHLKNLISLLNHARGVLTQHAVTSPTKLEKYRMGNQELMNQILTEVDGCRGSRRLEVLKVKAQYLMDDMKSRTSHSHGTMFDRVIQRYSSFGPPLRSYRRALWHAVSNAVSEPFFAKRRDFMQEWWIVMPPVLRSHSLRSLCGGCFDICARRHVALTLPKQLSVQEAARMRLLFDDFFCLSETESGTHVSVPAPFHFASFPLAEISLNVAAPGWEIAAGFLADFASEESVRKLLHRVTLKQRLFELLDR